jgi:hypothetical protein
MRPLPFELALVRRLVVERRPFERRAELALGRPELALFFAVDARERVCFDRFAVEGRLRCFVLAPVAMSIPP